MTPRRITTALVATVSVLLGAGALVAQASAAAAPDVTTGSATSASASAVTLNGTVNPEAQATTYTFQYGSSSSYGFQTISQSLSAGSSPQQVSVVIDGLEPGTTFHFRLEATNASGTTDGADRTFTTTGTAPPPPGASLAQGVTGGIGALTAHGVTLTAAVFPQGMPSVAYFEYGTSTSYGLQTAPVQVSGAASLAVSSSLFALQPGQTYHYRMAVVNAVGTSVGADQTFTTPPTRLYPSGLVVGAATTQLGGNTVIRVNGSVKLPAGVNTLAGCRGYLTLWTHQGAATLGLNQVKLNGDCTYSATISVRRRARTGVQVKVIFLGNTELEVLSGSISLGPV